MATAYWCVLVAALLPYAWTVVAKSTGERYDNRDPRAWLARQENPRARWANGAQLNGFEAFPAFAAGVLMAQLAGVEPRRIGVFAIAFVIARVLHGVFYLTGRHRLRSLAWSVGLLCVLALMGQAASRMAAA